MAGRKPDTKPGKVMVPDASKTKSLEDGSRSLTLAYNDSNGVRHTGEIIVYVENDVLCARAAVTA